MEWRNRCPEGVVSGWSGSTASSFSFILYISFTPVFSHSLLLMGRCTCSMVKYRKYAQQPQVHRTCYNVFQLFNRNMRNVISAYRFSHHTEASVSLKYTGRFLSAFGEFKAKQCLISTSSNSVASPLDTEKAFPFMTQNPRKPQMALEIKSQKKEIIC